MTGAKYIRSDYTLEDWGNDHGCFDGHIGLSEIDIAQDSSCQLTSECHLSDWMAMMFGVLDNTKSDPGVLEKYRYSVASSYWYGPLAEGFGNSYVSSRCGIEKSFLEETHLPFN